jgi:Pyruvate/2-oxoacid:ferredoxin oxidoreductase delta subunit
MFRITDDCIACILCEPDCPVGAVIESEPIAYAITNLCDGCKNESAPLCIKVCPVDCIVPDYSEREMLDGLDHEDPKVRVTFAKVNGHIKLPARVVENGLTDQDDEVRVAFSGRTDFIPVAFQIERGLTDKFAGVRASFARRTDISLSPHQIERGLTDSNDDVRSAVSNRLDFTPSAGQIERGLFDPCISVRCHFIERTDCEMTEDQFERIRYDSSAGVQTRLYHKRRATQGTVKPETVSKISKARSKNGPPPRNDGEAVLRTLNPILCDELKAVNSRLRQPLTPRNVLFGLKMAAENRSCVLIQPGYSGYAWSDRSIPVVFIAYLDGSLRARVRRANSYRNAQVTTAVWPELRGFPKGDIQAKLNKWASELDGGQMPLDVVLELPNGEIDGVVNEWKPS